MTVTAPAFGGPSADDHPDLLAIAKSFETRIRAAEDYLETEHRIPLELANELYDSGLWRTHMPRELGGLESDPVEWLDAVEEVSRINGSVGWLTFLHTGGTFMTPDTMAPILAKERWITAGNVGRAAGKAKRVPGGYRISGRWPFASGAPEANWLNGSSILYDENDEIVLSPVDGNPWIVGAMFHRSDVALIDTWDVLGLRGTGSCDFEVRDVFVPRAHVNERGMHFLQYDRPLFRTWFNVMGHAAHALGLAKAAIEEYVKAANAKAAHGSRRQGRSGKDQANQLALGRADAMVRSARLFAWDATREAYEDAQTSSPVAFELRVRTLEANVWAVQQAREAVELLFHQAGTPALFKGTALERIYRDILTAAQHTLVHSNSIDSVGEYLLTKDLPDGPQFDLSRLIFIMGPYPQTKKVKLPKLPDH